MKGLAIWGILPALLLGNDGFGALGAGGIIIGKTDAIAMAKEVLDIRYDQIKVDYAFVNESDHDITETIVFPLPPYVVGDPSAAYLGTIPDFKVVVNGRLVKFKTKVRAVIYDKNETDITQKLRDMGLSDYDIVMADYHVAAIATQHQKRLIQNGVLNPHWKPEYGIEPLWKNYVTYEWKQTFKAHEKLTVSHSYRPLCGGAVGICYANTADDHSRKELGKRYCIPTKTLDTLDTLAKNPQNYQDYPYPCLRAFSVDYVLKTANTWKDGIRDFHLIVRTKTPQESVSTCFSKTLHQTGATTYEVHLKNFRPKENLSLYFGNVDKHTPLQPTSKPPLFY